MVRAAQGARGLRTQLPGLAGCASERHCRPAPPHRCRLFLALFIISPPPALEMKAKPLQQGRPPGRVAEPGDGAGGGGSAPPARRGQGRLRSGFRAHLEPAGDAPGSSWHRIGCAARSRPAPGVFMVRGPRVGTGSSPGAGTRCRPRCTTPWWTFRKNTWKGRTAGILPGTGMCCPGDGLEAARGDGAGPRGHSGVPGKITL